MIGEMIIPADSHRDWIREQWEIIAEQAYLAELAQSHQGPDEDYHKIIAGMKYDLSQALKDRLGLDSHYEYMATHDGLVYACMHSALKDRKIRLMIWMETGGITDSGAIDADYLAYTTKFFGNKVVA